MRKYTLIIVEDDEDEQLFMKEGFEKANVPFDIISQVQNGDQLLNWLDEHPDKLPDIILSDLNMPGRNGYDVIIAIKENPEWSHIPVIITSTSSTKTIIDKCLALGAADYVVKPDTFINYVPYVESLYQAIEEKQLIK